MATYWHFVRELLYNIEWLSVRQIRIGILCTYWHLVRALPYYVIESTQSPWDLGSRIDKMDTTCHQLQRKCQKKVHGYSQKSMNDLNLVIVNPSPKLTDQKNKSVIYILLILIIKINALKLTRR